MLEVQVDNVEGEHERLRSMRHLNTLIRTGADAPSGK